MKYFNELSYYDICPSCLNPIQLIGLMGDKKAYEYCPYAVKNAQKLPIRTERLSEAEADVIVLCNLLKQQFDRIVYILEKELSMRCSKHFWEKTIERFIKAKGYFYPWLTEVNLPYIFAYFGVHHQNLYKQQFLIDSEIYNALKKYSKVEFVNMKNGYAMLMNKEGSFLNLYFRFANHTHHVGQGQKLNESFMFYIDDKECFPCKTIYSQKIEFDEIYFTNLINKGSGTYRNWELIELAENIIPAIEHNT